MVISSEAMEALLDKEDQEAEVLERKQALDPAQALAPPPSVLVPPPSALVDDAVFENNLLQPQDKDAAQLLKDYKYERAAGLPIGTTTNDNRQITQDQATINKAHKDTENAPTTRGFVVMDPKVAQLTRGDLSGLSKVERAADNITLWGSLTKAGIMMAQHGYAFIETAGELTGIKSLDEFGEKGRLELGKAKKDIKGKETDLFEIDSASDFANWMTSTLAQGAVQFAPQIAGAAAGAKGGAVLGTALAPFTAGVSLPVMTTLGTLIGVVLPSFIMSTGEAQVELKEAGKKAGMGEDVEAPGTVFTAGLFMAGLDSALPLKLWSKMSGKGIKAKVGKEIIRHSLAQIMKRSAKAGVKGMGLEALTETVQDVVKKVLIRNELDLDIIGDPKEFAKDIVRSMAGGAVVGKFMSAGVSVGTDVMANSRNTKAALDAMNDATTGEPLREGAPELAAEHIRAVLEEKGVESIFINADVLMDYVQRTDDPEGTLINLGIDETIADSMTNGTDVEIDIATFSEHIMGSAGYNILSMHIKTKPGEKSVSEAADFLWKNNPNLQTDLTAELDKLDLTDHERSLMQRIIDDMTPEKAAQTLAKMNSQTEAVMATLLNSIEERKVTSEAEQKSGRVEFLELEVQSLDKEIVALEDNIEAEGKSESPSIQTLNKLERELQRVRDVRNAKIQEQQDINIPQGQAAALRPEFQETIDETSELQPGTVQFVHYSDQQLTELDPAFEGTNENIRGGERNRSKDPNYPARTYVGLPGFEKEGGLGEVANTGRIALDTLYDFDGDPDKIRARATKAVIARRKRAGQVIQQNTAAFQGLVASQMEHLIKKDGYAGYRTQSNSGPVAALFDVTPTDTTITTQADIPLTPAQKKLRPKKIVTKASVLQDLGIKVTKEATRAARQGFREGVKAAKTLKAKQKAIVKIIDKLPIIESQRKILRNKIMAPDVNAKTGESTAKFDRVLDEVMARATVQIELQRKRQIRDAIDKELKRARPKKSGGKPIGKLGAHVHEVLENARKALDGITQEQASALLAAKENNPTDTPSAADMLNLQLMQLIANPESVDSTHMEDLLLSIKEVKDGGSAAHKKSKLNLIVQQEERRARWREALNPTVLVREKLDDDGNPVFEQGTPIVDDVGNPVLDEDGQPTFEPGTKPVLIRQPKKMKGNPYQTFGLGVENFMWTNWSGVWWTHLSRLMRTNDPLLAEQVQDDYDMGNESNNFQRNKQSAAKRMEAMMMNRLGINSKQLQDLILSQEDTEVNLGWHDHSDNQSREIKFRRGELIDRVAALSNPDVEERAKHKDGNAYTDAIIKRMRDELTGQERAQVEAFVALYENDLPRVNEVYARMWGVFLDKVKGGIYYPTRRILDTKGETNEDFLISLIQRGQVGAGQHKSRTGSVKPLINRTAFSTYVAHIAEMEYFIAYAEKVRDISATFDSKTLNEIELIYGQHMKRVMTENVQYFVDRGILNAKAGEGAFMMLMRNFAISQLAIKPQIMIKQWMSFPAMGVGVDTKLFMEGLAKFTKNPNEARRFLTENSEFYELRGIKNLDRDFEALTSSIHAGIGNKYTNPLGRNPSFAQAVMANVKTGDRGAIVLGGFAHYYAKKKMLLRDNPKMPEAEAHRLAIQSFQRQANRTQQSPNPDQTSGGQRGNPFFRIMSMFMSSPNALMRGIHHAVVEKARGRLGWNEFLRDFTYMYFIIPSLIQYAANAFHWDDEDQIRAATYGAINGILIFADVLDAVIGALTNKEDIFTVETRHPLRVITDLLAFYQAKEDISLEALIDGAKGINKSLNALSGATGLPIGTVFNMSRGLVKTLDGEVVDGIILMMGYSPYTLSKVNERASSGVSGSGNL